MFCYILSCKIRPREFIDRGILYAGYEKSEIKKQTRKDFDDQGTVVIQTPSFTTSKDFGYLLLSKFPPPKTSIFKLNKALPRSQIGYPLYPSRKVCWTQKEFSAKDSAQHLCKGV